MELSTQDERPNGKYGRVHLRYLREHHHADFTGLLLPGKLDCQLHEVDNRDTRQVNEIVIAAVKRDGADKMPKAHNSLRRVGPKNNRRACAEEIVLKEVVYG